jgi:hypothetical protein
MPKHSNFDEERLAKAYKATLTQKTKYLIVCARIRRFLANSLLTRRKGPGTAQHESLKGALEPYQKEALIS